MKNNLWIILLAIPLLLSSCHDMDEDQQEMMVTKDLPMRWAPTHCTVNDEMGIPIAPGVKCIYDQDGGCKWPTKCKQKNYWFVQLAIENTPGLTTETWGNPEGPLRGYDIQLELWREDPSTFYHPDSIPPDTIH